MPAVNPEITRLLHEYAQGDSGSLNAVIPLVYDELKSIANRQLARSSVRQQFSTTMLVHEAFEKIAGGQQQDFVDRRHFFAIAARAMRQIVVDAYRARTAEKRGGEDRIEITLEAVDRIMSENPEQVLRMSQAIDQLVEAQPELAEVLEMSGFAGLSTQEIADLQDTTVRTVQRKLFRARAWIVHLLETGAPPL